MFHFVAYTTAWALGIVLAAIGVPAFGFILLGVMALLLIDKTLYLKHIKG